MSGHGGGKKTASTRLIQLLSLLVTFGVLYGVTRVTPELESHLGTVAAIGFLLLAGTLMSELLETIGLPQLRSGQVVELAGVGTRFEGCYLIEQSTHTIDSNGYSTSLNLQRNALS